MNILTEWSLTEISLVLGIVISIIGLIKPVSKWLYKKIERSNQRADTIDTLPEVLNKLADDVEAIKEHNITQNEEIASLNDKIDNVELQLMDFERQEIVREVNSTFYGFANLQSIPDDILEDTIASCEIYIRNGYNHNTKPKCELLIKERERRLAQMEGHHE